MGLSRDILSDNLFIDIEREKVRKLLSPPVGTTAGPPLTTDEIEEQQIHRKSAFDLVNVILRKHASRCEPPPPWRVQLRSALGGGE